jgi:hypothetical protein
MQENPAAKAERDQKEAVDRAEAERQADEARRNAMTPEDLAWEDNRPHIEAFRQTFDTARKGKYQPGSLFDSKRNDFMKLALGWSDARSRQAAGELLRETMSKAWGMPGNRESKQRINDAIGQLVGR